MILLYIISSKSPNGSANKEKSYLQKEKQPPGAGRISELLQALKLWRQKHIEETGTSHWSSFKILISEKKCTISSQSCPFQIYF